MKFSFGSLFEWIATIVGGIGFICIFLPIGFAIGKILLFAVGIAICLRMINWVIWKVMKIFQQ
jgi:hypothetical protein